VDSRSPALDLGAAAARPAWSISRRRLSTRTLEAQLDRLYRAAWALCGSREDAEDLVQETVARVLARPRFVRAGTEHVYLMRALRNTFLDLRRVAARRVPTDALPDRGDPVKHPQADPADSLAQHDALFTAIAALPGDYRDALVSVDLAGLTYREAAKALRTSEETLTIRLYRARQQVVRRMKDDGTHSSREATNAQG
jgi:RNA polymerase sigma-70 factor, ECF subfamily